MRLELLIPAWLQGALLVAWLGGLAIVWALARGGPGRRVLRLLGAAAWPLWAAWSLLAAAAVATDMMTSRALEERAAQGRARRF